jgi:hypothetical protein
VSGFAFIISDGLLRRPLSDQCSDLPETGHAAADIVNTVNCTTSMVPGGRGVESGTLLETRPQATPSPLAELLGPVRWRSVGSF